MNIKIFQHSARSYFDMYNALKLAYPTADDWLFQNMAGMFDFVSELINNVATDILSPYTRESAYSFAARNDYMPKEADGAQVEVVITLNTAKNKILSPGFQIGGISPATGELVIYELLAEASSGGTDQITGNFKQQQTFENINIGRVTSTEDFSDYPIDGYINIIKSSISLSINGQAWDRVDNFDASGPDSRHFILIYQSQGKCRIKFGDNNRGMKPPAGYDILGMFRTTRGFIGRLNAGEIKINVGGDPDIKTINNVNTASGGNDSESISNIIENAQGNNRLRDAIFFVEDLEIAAKKASSNVVKSLGVGGYGAATVYIVPSGGGAPAQSLLDQVKSFMMPLTLFGVMPLEVLGANYLPVSISATVTFQQGYDPVVVKNLVKFAMTLASSAVDNQIIEYMNDFGIDKCRSNVINVLWPWNFSSTENEALQAIINKWKELLRKKAYRDWGYPLEVGDLWIMGETVEFYGVDIFNLNSPISNIVPGELEIIDTGTVLVNE